ncbi:MAG: ABC transporter permease [Bacteroidetes bacterium]|nr:ABC transporter permease [Bacteroidota bacterium]
MSEKLYIHLAKRLWQASSKKKSIATPVVKIAEASIALGVCVMVLTISVITGFKNQIKSKAIGFSGDIMIQAYSNNNSLEQEPITLNKETIRKIKANANVLYIQPYAIKNAIIKTAHENQGVVLKGVGSSFNWDFLKANLVEGSVPAYNDTSVSDQMLISKSLAQKLQVRIGDKLLTYFVSRKKNDSTLQEGYEQRVRKLTIGGIFETGFSDMDESMVYADIAQIKKLNYWSSSQQGGFEIKLKNNNDLEAETNTINEYLDQNLEAKSVKEIYSTLFSWLSLLDSNAVIIIVLMILVAVINMISALLILILERSHTIGSLKAFGADNTLIQKVFLYQSFKMLAKGLLVGNSIGLALCWLQKYFKLVTLNPQSYYVAYVPIEFSPIWLLTVNLLTVCCCFFMMLLPVLIISKINPIKTLRFK